MLKRLYLDRILTPKFSGRDLVCKKCRRLLGVTFIYKKEKRLSFRLFARAVTKKIVSADKLHQLV